MADNTDPFNNSAWMLRATQQPAPITGMGQIDAILAMMAPTIGAQFFGMGNAVQLPNQIPGVSAYESFYARDITSPLFNTMNQQMFGMLGGGMGHDTAQILARGGLAKALGMSDRHFISQMSEMGSSPIGAMLLQQAAGMAPMQSLVGGNLANATQDIFMMRNSLATMRGSLAGSDITSQLYATENATDFGQRLFGAIYGLSDGSTGLIPNQAVTRGFKVDEITKLARVMADRGTDVFSTDEYGIRGYDAGGMRGDRVSNSYKLESVKNMTKVMETLSNLTGDSDMGRLVDSLDKITNGQAFSSRGAMDPERLNQKLREISATAHALGTSSQLMMETISSVNQSMNGMLGISPGAQAMGVTGGGYSNLGVSSYIASHIASVAQNKYGGSVTQEQYQQVAAQQTAMFGIGVNSTAGRSMELVGYLMENGLAPADTLQRITNAPTMGARQSLVNDVFRSAFGSTAEAKSITDNAAMMQFIRSNTGAGVSEQVVAGITTIQQREHGERIREQLSVLTGRDLAGTGSQQGFPSVLSTRERAELMQRSYLNVIDNSVLSATAKQDMRAGIESAFTRGMLVDPTAAISGMEGLVGSVSALDPIRADMRRVYGDALQNAAQGVVVGQFGAEDTVGMAQLRQMNSMSLTGADAASASAINSLYSDFVVASSRGDTAAARQIHSQMNNQLNALSMGTENTALRVRMEAARVSASKQNEDNQRRAGLNAEAKSRLGTAIAMFGEENAGVAEMEARAYAGILDGAINMYGDDIGAANGYLADQATYGTFKSGVPFKSLADLKAARDLNLGISQQLGLARGAAANRWGIVGVDGALADRRDASAMFIDARIRAADAAVEEQMIQNANVSMKLGTGQLVLSALRGDGAAASVLRLQDIDTSTAEGKALASAAAGMGFTDKFLDSVKSAKSTRDNVMTAARALQPFGAIAAAYNSEIMAAVKGDGDMTSVLSAVEAKANSSGKDGKAAAAAVAGYIGAMRAERVSLDNVSKNAGPLDAKAQAKLETAMSAASLRSKELEGAWGDVDELTAGDVAWWNPWGATTVSGESVALLGKHLGLAAPGKSGVDHTNAILKQLGNVSTSQLANLSSEDRATVTRLQVAALEHRKKADEKTKSAGEGGSGGTFKMEGVMQLRDQSGRVIHNVDMSQVTMRAL